MKKIYTTALALIGFATIAQAQFFTAVPYKGAFPVTDGLTGITSNDWTEGWTNFDPQMAVYPAVDSVINTNISSNRTLSPNHVYQLVGNVAVTNGATLTILPGTIIRGDKASASCLIISAGSKINAQGTQTQPIVFTSNFSAGNRGPGDWGGVILLGNGITNTACGTCSTNPNTNYIEGFATTFPEILYGGNNNADNSGTFRYVRIEFSGIALSTASNSELNGLTLGGVGSGTTIDHIMVSFNGDDAFEWFGGAVNAKYLVSYRNLDDDFDTDFGWAGMVQFGLIVRDKDLSDAAGDSNGYESDNYNPGVGRTPITNGVFSNITMIGPKRDGSVALPSPNYYGKAFRLRRNTGISTFNSIYVGWNRGLSVESSSTMDNYGTSSLDSMAVFAYNLSVNQNATSLQPAVFSASSSAPQAFYQGFWGVKGNDSTQTVANINWVNAFPANLETKGDWRLNASSTAASGANFSDPRLNGLVSVKDIANSNINKLVLFPNPTSDLTYLVVAVKNAAPVTVKVIDVTGKTAMIIAENASTIAGENVFNINAVNLNNGVYFVNVTSAEGTQTIRMVINK